MIGAEKRRHIIWQTLLFYLTNNNNTGERGEREEREGTERNTAYEKAWPRWIDPEKDATWGKEC
ncbi:hypothetical protein KSZ_56520 [Dictyobacter formicarum]|uniref:Uncharacterized protein n=1 Tax=Dictyobacter formicarum TaxID=2778368 RepID=A0ABQ3VRA4_9CHLR|nr:hypothetical protein KSZ_56520 [Dictyobacter formicarum]